MPAILALCAARSSCSPVSPSRLQPTLRRPRSPLPRLRPAGRRSVAGHARPRRGDAATLLLGRSATARRPQGRSSRTSTAAGSFVATVTATNAAGEVAQAQVAVTALAGERCRSRAPTRAGYRRRRRARRVPATRRPGRTRADLPRPNRTSPRRAWRERPLPHATPPPLCPGRTTPATAPRARPSVSCGSARRSKRHCSATVAVGSTADPAPAARARRGRIGLACASSATAGASAAAAERVRLPTGSAGTLRVELVVQARVAGYAPARKVLSAQVVLPSLAPGARGPSVARARATPRRSSATRCAASTASTATTPSKRCSPSRR